MCNDAGITSDVILSEYGFGDFGQFGGQRTAWDLSHVDACERPIVFFRWLPQER